MAYSHSLSELAYRGLNCCYIGGAIKTLRNNNYLGEHDEGRVPFHYAETVP